jgi:uncharacterized membrane protein YdcZ (DUF606 family)
MCLDGTNGLNYGFQGLSDEDGVAFLFASNGNNGTNADLFMRKLNPDGTWAWNGGTTVPFVKQKIFKAISIGNKMTTITTCVGQMHDPV